MAIAAPVSLRYLRGWQWSKNLSPEKQKEREAGVRGRIKLLEEWCALNLPLSESRRAELAALVERLTPNECAFLNGLLMKKFRRRRGRPPKRANAESVMAESARDLRILKECARLHAQGQTREQALLAVRKQLGVSGSTVNRALKRRGWSR